MCKFKFTSGAKPSLMEKKLLTSTHHMTRHHQPQPTPQPRQKPLDLLTQQQLLGKLLVNEQAKLVNNATRTNFNSTRTSSNSIRPDFASPFNTADDFKDFNPAQTDFKTDFSDLSPMDFDRAIGRRVDPMMSSLMRSTSSDVEMNDESDETASNDFPDYNAAFSLPPLSPHETLSESLNRESMSPSEMSSSFVNEGDSLARFSNCDNSSSSGPPTLNRRKSRKSQAREKLEKTFKEKGFLIQTQQLESAEGATYCKFRQLRKFTRYLFRSWKTHLPGEVVNENYNMQ